METRLPLSIGLKPSLLLKGTLVVGLILVLLLSLSLKQLISVIYLEQAKTLVNSAEETFKKTSVLNGLELVENSLVWNRKNAEALSYKSALLFYQWQEEDLEIPPENSAVLMKALDSLDQAIKLKPNWPFYFIQKAQIYSRYSELGDSFYQVFNEAYDLGKYETNTALSLLKLGVAQWPKLSDETRGTVIELMHLSLQQKSNSPKELWKLVDANNLGTWFCFKLPSSQKKNIFCSYK